MRRSLGVTSIIHAVRIAASEAARRGSSERNPAYAKALDAVATALEEARVSVRSDGNYYMVRLPDSIAINDDEAQRKER